MELDHTFNFHLKLTTFYRNRDDNLTFNLQIRHVKMLFHLLSLVVPNFSLANMDVALHHWARSWVQQ